MMNTLLESKPRKQKSTTGTILSIALHSLVIFFAVFATARAGIREDRQQREQKVQFVQVKPEEPPPPEVKKETPPPPPKTPPPAPRAAPLPPAPKAEIAPPKGFQTLQAPINIPVEIPKIDLSAKVTNEADFTGKGVAGGTSKGAEGSSGTNPAGTRVASNEPYFEYQVERAVQQISGGSPSYPETLRSAGVEGEVVAQFVVNERGRVETGTFKVLNSSNPQFTDAVRRALSNMRFRPAQIGGQAVSQVVEQPFVFKLNR